MKKAWILFASLAAFVPSAFAADVWREKTDGAEFDRTGRFDTGVYAAGTFIEGGDADNSGFVGVDASYGLRPWAAVGVEGGWTETSSELGQDLEIAIFMAEMIVRFNEARREWNGYRFAPYVSFGAGGIWSSLDRPAGDGDDSSIGWKAGIGADWFLNKNWALNLEADYYQSIDELPIDSSTNPENKLDFWTVGGGLKYAY